MPRLFERRGDGACWLTLYEEDAQLLAALATQLAGLLADEDAIDDEVRDRLFPRAYLDPTEEESEQTFRDLVRPDLLAEKLASLQALAAGLVDAPREGPFVQARLDDEGAEQWLVAVNDLRLTLGTRLGIEEDTDYGAVDRDDPASLTFLAYAFLTELAGAIVDVLLGDDWQEPFDPFSE